MSFTWKPNIPPCDLSAERVRAILDAIRERHGGKLEPDAIVNEAAEPTHPLHHAFPWNDTEAAHQWRCDLARRLILRVRIVEKKVNRGTHRIHDTYDSEIRPEAKTLSFVPTDNDKPIEEALRLLRGLAARFRHLRELNKVWKAIDEVAALEREAM